MLGLLLALTLQVAPIQTRSCGPASGDAAVAAAKFCDSGYGIVGIASLHATGNTLTIALLDSGAETLAAHRLSAERVTLMWLLGWKGATKATDVSIVTTHRGVTVVKAGVTAKAGPVIWIK